MTSLVMEKEDNSGSQSDELEALWSIYGNDFNLEGEKTFSILIHIGDAEGEEATLIVSFVPTYPSSSPPIYELSIPWMRGPEKAALMDTLDKLYQDKPGESIVYTWVEKIREILYSKRPNSFDPPLPSSPPLSPVNWERKEEEFHLPDIVTGEALTDRKSTFQAHLAPVNSMKEVKLIMSELKKSRKIGSATHNMFAYRFSEVSPDGQEKWLEDYEDDGEHHAGGRLLHLLKTLECKNVLLVVSRWFGGVMLYGDRFKHISNVARILLEQHKHIGEKKTKTTK